MKITIFKDFIGQVIDRIETNDGQPVPEEYSSKSGEIDHLNFYTRSGKRFVMYHEQDCCESVYLHEIVGNMNDLIGHPILEAEEIESESEETEWGTSTWTFYKFATIKGHVNLRWLGESNGYYSESVFFGEKEPAPASRDDGGSIFVTLTPEEFRALGSPLTYL